MHIRLLKHHSLLNEINMSIVKNNFLAVF